MRKIVYDKVQQSLEHLHQCCELGLGLGVSFPLTESVHFIQDSTA